MRVLVTGASGQLGSYLMEELAGHDAIGVDLVPGDRAIEGDIRDREAMLQACEGAEAVIHCAAQVSVERSMESPLHDMDLNVTGTVNLLKAAVEVQRQTIAIL